MLVFFSTELVVEHQETDCASDRWLAWCPMEIHWQAAGFARLLTPRQLIASVLEPICDTIWHVIAHI